MQPSHVATITILPYRMVGQHYNKQAVRAIRRWLSFSWELGPNQTFRTRWGQDGTVHRTGGISSILWTRSNFHHHTTRWNLFCTKLCTGWHEEKEHVNMLGNQDKSWCNVSERPDKDCWPLYAKHPSVVYMSEQIWVVLLSHVYIQVSYSMLDCVITTV